jgi:hypothetical protein
MEVVEFGSEDSMSMWEQPSSSADGRLPLVKLKCTTVFLVELAMVKSGEDFVTWRRLVTYSLLNVARLVNGPDITSSSIYMLPFKGHLSQPQTCIRITELRTTAYGEWLIRTEDGEQLLKSVPHREPAHLQRVYELSQRSEENEQ